MEVGEAVLRVDRATSPLDLGRAVDWDSDDDDSGISNVSLLSSEAIADVVTTNPVGVQST
jgi:hypothetical protein